MKIQEFTQNSEGTMSTKQESFKIILKMNRKTNVPKPMEPMNWTPLIPRTLVLTILISFICFSGQAQKNVLDIEGIVNGEFDTETPGALNWIDDALGYVVLEEKGKGLLHYPPPNFQRFTLFELRQLGKGFEKAKLQNFSFSEDRSKVLLTLGPAPQKYVLYDLRTKKAESIDLGGVKGVRQVELSPDNKMVAYLQRANLYIHDLLTGRTEKVFPEGNDSQAGPDDMAHWQIRNYSWSPDSKNIAFVYADTGSVKNFRTINNTDSIYPSIHEFSYVKPGETMPQTKVGTVDLIHKTTQWVAPRYGTREHYIKKVEWRPGSGELIVFELNRNQNEMSILETDTKSGGTKTILVEREDTFVDTWFDLRLLERKKGIIWTSERDGWKHIYTKDAKEGKPTLITPGNFDVIEMLEVDAKEKWVYFIASPHNGLNRYLYRADLDGKGKVERLTPEVSVGYNTYKIAKSGKWAVHTLSHFGNPPKTTIVDLPGHNPRVLLEDNKVLRAKLEQLDPMPVEYFSASIEPGVTIDYRMIKPKGFNPAKKYPVVYHVYSMPANQITKNLWGGDRYLFHQLLSKEGFVVITIDGRGTPAPYGKQWRKSIYKRHGILPADDIAAATKVILEDHPYLDGENIGVYGWSGGGLMSALLILRHPDLFKAAVPGAFLSHHKFYHAGFTERFMGLPQDNPEAYE